MDLHSSEQRELTLVFPSDAAPVAGRVSVLAPLGCALMVAARGNRRMADAGGLRRLRIDQVTAGDPRTFRSRPRRTSAHEGERVMNRQPLRIVCATDLQPHSDAAMERAGLLADQLAAQLTLLHVVAPSDSEQALEDTLYQAQTTLRARARRPLWRARELPGTAIRTGNPARLVVAEVSNLPRADLLVIGPHRRRPMRDALEGTIAGKVMASRTCPVLMIQAPAGSAYRRVLLALDVSSASAGAIRAAESLVLSDQATAKIVHAQDSSNRAC